MFAVNAEAGAADELLQRHGLPTGVVHTPSTNLALQTGDTTVLFDAGFGDQQDLAPDSGRLIPSLKPLGIAPESVTDVVISHFHVDRVGVSSDGVLNFPNAQVHFPQVEWDLLDGPATGNETVDAFAALAKAKLEPALSRDRLRLYGDEDELVSGVQALFTPGHSPGHHSFMLASGGERLCATVDVAVHPLLTVERPEWLFGFDQLPGQTVTTRRQVLGRAADEQLQVFSGHFPFPGLGYVVRDGEGFRYLSQA